MTMLRVTVMILKQSISNIPSITICTYHEKLSVSIETRRGTALAHHIERLFGNDQRLGSMVDRSKRDFVALVTCSRMWAATQTEGGS